MGNKVCSALDYVGFRGSFEIRGTHFTQSGKWGVFFSINAVIPWMHSPDTINCAAISASSSIEHMLIETNN